MLQDQTYVLARSASLNRAAMSNHASFRIMPRNQMTESRTDMKPYFLNRIHNCIAQRHQILNRATTRRNTIRHRNQSLSPAPMRGHTSCVHVAHSIAQRNQMTPASKSIIESPKIWNHTSCITFAHCNTQRKQKLPALMSSIDSRTDIKLLFLHQSRALHRATKPHDS